MEDLPERWDRRMGAELGVELGVELGLLQVKCVVCVHHLVMVLHKRWGLRVGEGWEAPGMGFQGLFKDVQDAGSNVLVSHGVDGWGGGRGVARSRLSKVFAEHGFVFKGSGAP